MSTESKSTWTLIVGYIIVCVLLIVILKCLGAV
jgi:uncharacterized integral membrane protein